MERTECRTTNEITSAMGSGSAWCEAGLRGMGQREPMEIDEATLVESAAHIAAR